MGGVGEECKKGAGGWELEVATLYMCYAYALYTTLHAYSYICMCAMCIYALFEYALRIYRYTYIQTYIYALGLTNMQLAYTAHTG
jgi:hypothetical protein